METRWCRVVIGAFEGLQIRNALGVLALGKAAAIAHAASYNVGASVFRFSTSPLPQPPMTITNKDDTITDDGVLVDASFIDASFIVQ